MGFNSKFKGLNRKTNILKRQATQRNDTASFRPQNFNTFR